MEDCPSLSDIKSFLAKDGHSTSEVAAHVESCETCLDLADTLTADPRITRALKSQQSQPLDPVRVQAVLTGVADQLSDITSITQPNVAPEGPIGPYQLVSAIGQGGMGAVYLAEDPTLDRRVALKVIHEDKLTETARQRFLSEAVAVARLRSENVVRIFSVGEEAGAPYIAMEFVEGVTLQQQLRSCGRFNWETIRDIALQLCSGLQAIHDATIVHRDLKPSNICIEADTSRVIILDFGLARSPFVGNSLTETGQILGTPKYMSPEQSRGQVAGIRSDLWSLGCILYEMTTGTPPFHGESATDVLASITRDEPLDPRQSADVSPAFAELILRLLRKNPTDRPSSANEVAREIESVSGTRRTKTSGRFRVLSILAGCCLLVLA
ncbi:MAG: serine/threonine-protein kinase, partial [Planctomycetaceae bacterium]